MTHDFTRKKMKIPLEFRNNSAMTEHYRHAQAQESPAFLQIRHAYTCFGNDRAKIAPGRICSWLVRP